MQKTKKLEFVWFFDDKSAKKTQGKPIFYNDMMELIHVKTKKTLILFCFFYTFMSKKLKKQTQGVLVYKSPKPKKTQEKQKKQLWVPNQTFSEKFCFFLFFGFSRVF